MILGSRRALYSRKFPPLDVRDDAAVEEEVTAMLRSVGNPQTPLAERVGGVTALLHKARHAKLNGVAEGLWHAVRDLTSGPVDGLEAALKVMQALLKQTAASDPMLALEREFLQVLVEMEGTDRRRLFLRLSALRAISEFGKLGATIATDMVAMLVAIAQSPESVECRHWIFELIAHYVCVSPMSFSAASLHAVCKVVQHHVRQTVNVSVGTRTSSTYYTGVKYGLVLLEKMVTHNVVQCPHLLDIITILCLTVRMHVVVGDRVAPLLSLGATTAAPETEHTTPPDKSMSAMELGSMDSPTTGGTFVQEAMSASAETIGVSPPAPACVAVAAGGPKPPPPPPSVEPSEGDDDKNLEGYGIIGSVESSPPASPRDVGDGEGGPTTVRRASAVLEQVATAISIGEDDAEDDPPAHPPAVAAASGRAEGGGPPMGVPPAAPATTSSGKLVVLAPPPAPTTPPGLPPAPGSTGSRKGAATTWPPLPEGGEPPLARSPAPSTSPAHPPVTTPPSAPRAIAAAAVPGPRERATLTMQSKAVLTSLLGSELCPSVVYVLCAVLMHSTADTPRLEAWETDRQQTLDWEEGMARVPLGGGGDDGRPPSYERDVEAMQQVVAMHGPNIHNLDLYLGGLQHSQPTAVHLMKVQGAIFLLANACWGRERLPNMGTYFPLAVAALHRALAVCDPEVTYEVLLTSKKLIKTFGGRLRTEWDGLLLILRVAYLQHKHFTLRPVPERHRAFIEKLKAQLRETAELVYRECTTGHYLGDDDEADATFDALKSVLSFEVLQDLLRSRFDRIHPSDSQWLDHLAALMARYYVGHNRDAVRRMSLQLLYGLLMERFPYFATEVLDAALLPFLQNIFREPDMAVLQMTCHLLLTAASRLSLSHDVFQRVVDVLSTVLLIPHLPSPLCQSLALQLVKLFEDCLGNYPPYPAIVVFRALTHLAAHPTRDVRLTVYTAFAQLDADADYHVSLGPTFSPYVTAGPGQERETAEPEPAAAGAAALDSSFRWPEEHRGAEGAEDLEDRADHRDLHEPRVRTLPMVELVEKLLARLEVEDDAVLFRMILVILHHYLASHYVLCAVPVATLCHGLAHALNGREDFFFLLQAAVRSGGGAGDEDLAALRPRLGDFCGVPGLQLLLRLLRQLAGYRLEMAEPDVAVMMKMLKKMMTLCAMGGFEDRLETAMAFFDLLSIALLEFRYHFGPPEISEFVLGQHGLDAFARLEERGQAALLETLWLMVHSSPYFVDGLEDDPSLRALARWSEARPRHKVVEKVIGYVLPLVEPGRHSFRVVHLALHVLGTWFTKCPHQRRSTLLNRTIATALLPSAAPSAVATCLGNNLLHVPYPTFYPHAPQPEPPTPVVAPPRRDQSLFTKFFTAALEKPPAAAEAHEDISVRAKAEAPPAAAAETPSPASHPMATADSDNEEAVPSVPLPSTLGAEDGSDSEAASEDGAAAADDAAFPLLLRDALPRFEVPRHPLPG